MPESIPTVAKRQTLVVLVAALVTLLALLTAAPAGAHPGHWWWTAGRADYRLLADPTVPSRFIPLTMSAITYDAVEDADCVGIGARIRNLYRHFNCQIDLVEYEHYYDDGTVAPYRRSFVRILHVTGIRSFVLTKP
jgi:hypothetical protein